MQIYLMGRGTTQRDKVDSTQTFQHTFVCYPKADNRKRFLLGEKGNRSLVAIGLNPSLANAFSLDPTSKNIKALAAQNRCDGWYLLNLYPKRTPKPNQLPAKPNKLWLKENLAYIFDFIENEKSISKIVFCWGNYVDQYHYLKECRWLISQRINQLKMKPYCLGVTQRQHPMHPSPLVINRFFGGVQGVQLIPFHSL